LLLQPSRPLHHQWSTLSTLEKNIQAEYDAAVQLVRQVQHLRRSCEWSRHRPDMRGVLGSMLWPTTSATAAATRPTTSSSPISPPPPSLSPSCPSPSLMLPLPLLLLPVLLLPDAESAAAEATSSCCCCCCSGGGKDIKYEAAGRGCGHRDGHRLQLEQGQRCQACSRVQVGSR